MGQPGLAQPVDLLMISRGPFVVVFESVDPRQHLLHFGGGDSAEARKEALFFIGGVLRRGFTKVEQSRLEGSFLFLRERPALRLAGDRDQDVEKTLDAAMSVRKEPHRIVIITFAFRPDHHRHVARGYWLVAGAPPILVPITSPETISSTRRFCWRPAAVELDPMGRVSPNPSAER